MCKKHYIYGTFIYVYYTKMTEILLWVYMFGWKSLVAIPLCIIGIAALVELFKEWRGVLGAALIFWLIPSILYTIIFFIGSRIWVPLYYGFPVIYVLYVWGAYKIITRNED